MANTKITAANIDSTSTGITLADLTVNGDINLGDNNKAIFGAGSDASIFSDGSNGYMRGFLALQNNVGDQDFISFADGGATSLYYDNAPKLATTSSGIDVTGTAVTDGLTVAGNVSVDGGSIKLDGNYPTGSNNVALGDTAGDSLISGSIDNTLIGSQAGTAFTDADYNTAIGFSALKSDTLGSKSTAVGRGALLTQNFTSATDAHNTAVGFNAGVLVTTGVKNTFIGSLAGDATTSANENTAVGYHSLGTNQTGADNVALGAFSLFNNTASFNTSVGSSAMEANTTGANNTAVGYQSLLSNQTGADNTAVGRNALDANVSGANNTAVGEGALTSSTASHQTAVGKGAGQSVSTGAENVLVGHEAGRDGNFSASTMIGRRAGAITTGINNTFVGHECGTLITTGAKNSILGRFSGNAGGLDIRTSSNNIVLSDGDGNPRLRTLSDGSTVLGGNMGAVPAKKTLYLTTLDATSSAYCIEMVGTQTGTDGRLMFWDLDNTNSGGAYFVYAQNSTGNCFNIRGDGDVENTNNSYGSISDLKLKENVQDASSQWEDIKALQIRKYSFKKDNLSSPNQLGVIAQELEQAGMSGLVKEDADINPSTGEDLGTTTKKVKYSILYMKAVKALQEAIIKIEDLESRIEALEG